MEISGYKDGKAPNGEVLHHPYGRFGSNERIYLPVTPQQHTQIHAELGYGRNGGFYQYRAFENWWDIARRVIGG